MYDSVVNASLQALASPPVGVTGCGIAVPSRSLPGTAVIWLGLAAVLLSACAARKGDTVTSSQTFYLRNADAIARAAARTPRGAPVSKTPATASEPPPANSPKPGIEAAVPDEHPPEPVAEIQPFADADWAHIRKLPYAEQVSTLQGLLLKHVHTLSNDQADSACLILQIIPRESVFDRSVKPRQKLLDYVRQVNTVNDLMDIEKAINNPKG